MTDEATMKELARITDVLDRIHADLYSVNPTRPGMMLRQDRTETQIGNALSIIKWIGGGGLLGLAGTLVLLYELLQNFPTAAGY